MKNTSNHRKDPLKNSNNNNKDELITISKFIQFLGNVSPYHICKYGNSQRLCNIPRFYLFCGVGTSQHWFLKWFDIRSVCQRLQRFAIQFVQGPSTSIVISGPFVFIRTETDWKFIQQVWMNIIFTKFIFIYRVSHMDGG